MDKTKYAIRIFHGDGTISLYAVCKNSNGQVGRHSELAKREIRNGTLADTSSWVSIMVWN